MAKSKRKFDESKVTRDASGRFAKSGFSGSDLAYEIKRTNPPMNSRSRNQNNQGTFHRNGNDHKNKHLQGRDRMRRLGGGHGMYGIR